MTVTANYLPTAIGTNAFTNPTNAYTHNQVFATAAPGKNTSIAGIWKTWGITKPANAGTITKVEVGIDWYVSTTASIATDSFELSYNGGTNWTTAITRATADTESHTADGLAEVYIDCTSGRSWTWAELNDTNFQVRYTAIQGNSSTAVTFYLDTLYVRITYNDVISSTKNLIYRIISFVSSSINLKYTIRQFVLWSNLNLYFNYNVAVGSSPVFDQGPYRSDGTFIILTGGGPAISSLGKYNNAIYCSLIDNGYMSFDNTNIKSIGQHSVMLWVKRTDAGYNWPRLFLNGDINTSITLCENATGTAGSERGDGNILARVTVSAVNYTITTTTTPLIDGNWHHICMTWDASSLRLYIDGVLYGSPVSASGTLGTATGTVGYTMGDNAGSYKSRFVGYTDDLKVFNKALNANEISQQMLEWYFSRYSFLSHIRGLLPKVSNLIYRFAPLGCYFDSVDIAGFHNNITKYGELIYTAVQGSGRDPYVIKYNGSSWSAPVKAGTTLLPSDGHGAPAIIRDSNGYLHVFYGAHDSPFKYAKSNSPDDITAWTDNSVLFSRTGAYPVPLLRQTDGRIFVFYRNGTSNMTWAYTYSDDGGATWAVDTQWFNSGVAGDYLYISDIGQTMTFRNGHWCINFGANLHKTSPNNQRENFYFFYFDLTNLHFYTIAGTDMGTTVSRASLDTNCIVLDSLGKACYGGQVNWTRDGTPISAVHYEYATGLYKIVSLEWNGASWINQRDICTSSRVQWPHVCLFRSGKYKEYTSVLVDNNWEDKNIKHYRYDWSSKAWTQQSVYVDATRLFYTGYYWYGPILQPTPESSTWIFQEWALPLMQVVVGGVDTEGNLAIYSTEGGWNTKTIVRALKNLKYGLITHLIEKTIFSLYRILKTISRTTSFQYNILLSSVINSIKILRYNLNNYISSTKSYKYNIMKSLTAILKAIYNVFNLASYSLVFRYSLRNLSASVKNYIYNIRNYVSISGKYRYNLLNKISSLFNGLYNIRKSISSIRNAIYSIRNFLLVSVISRYNIFSKITSPRIFVYDIRNVITSTKRAIYNLMGELSVVLKVPYHIRNFVSSVKKSVYNLLNKINSTTLEIYRIINIVASTKKMIYNIGGRLWRAILATYNIINIVKSPDSKYVYNIRKLLVSSNNILYKIRNFAVSSKSFIYNIGGRLQNALRMIYNLRGLVISKTVNYYDIRNIISKTNQSIYNLRNRVSKEMRYLYSILTSVAVQSKAVFKYAIGGLVNVILSFKYKILGATFSELVGPYYILMNELYDYFNSLTAANKTFEGFKIYRGTPRNIGLFFPCIIIDIQTTDAESMYGGDYMESCTITLKLMFTKKFIKTISGVNLMGDGLSKYFKEKLLISAKSFISTSINTGNFQIIGTTFGPTKPKQTLYGTTATIQFSFKGGNTNWLKT